MSYGWEGNCMSEIVLAICVRLKWFIHVRVQRLPSAASFVGFTLRRRLTLSIKYVSYNTVWNGICDCNDKKPLQTVV